MGKKSNHPTGCPREGKWFYRMTAYLITKWNPPLYISVWAFIFRCAGKQLPRFPITVVTVNLSNILFPVLPLSLCLQVLLRQLQKRDERLCLLTLSLVIYLYLLWGRRLWKMWEQFTHQCFKNLHINGTAAETHLPIGTN